jgi:hypothetical protein
MGDELEIPLNRPQAEVHAVNANKTYCLWGRATGKSNGGLGPRIIRLFDKMPRAQIGMVCPSYIMGFKQILPNVIGFLENKMNLLEGENFVIGKKPLDGWEKPIIPVFDYKNVVSFDTGNVMPLLSLEAEGPGNGFNLQALVGDEAKFYKERKLKEIIRAIRGCNKEFGHLAEFQSQWYFTDKFEGNVQWMLDKKALMNPALIKAVLKMQIELEALMQQAEQTPSDDLNKRIYKVDKMLNQVRKSLVFVSEASAEENREILGDKYFEDQRQDSTQLEYDVAILNKDPDRVENMFYPSLDEKHYYHTCGDVDPLRPLILACDYQWRISPIATCQYGKLPGGKEISLNFVYSCHTLAPEGLMDAIDNWCEHFKYHINKTVYYLFDKTAVGKNPTSKPFFQTVMERLRSNGWKALPLNMGETPRHDDKFRMINKYLKGQSNIVPIKIHSTNSESMLKSMKLSPALTYNGKTSKDKSTEKNLSYPPELSTHYSDVFDMLVYGCLALDMVPKGSSTFSGVSIT